MQKSEAIHQMQRDLKDAVSGIRRDEYRRTMERAKDFVDLRLVELKVRTDSRLTPVHRGELLARLEGMMHSSAPGTLPEHTRLQSKTEERQAWRIPR